MWGPEATNTPGPCSYAPFNKGIRFQPLAVLSRTILAFIECFIYHNVFQSLLPASIAVRTRSHDLQSHAGRVKVVAPLTSHD